MRCSATMPALHGRQNGEDTTMGARKFELVTALNENVQFAAFTAPLDQTTEA
jgi:hypothetical protein